MKQLPDNLQAARLRCSADRPYLSAALWNLVPVESPGLGTLAVDKFYRLYYDPALDWTPAELTGVMYHEINHLLRNHPGRSKDILDCDNRAFNVACDAEINDDLIKEGVELPEGIVTPTALGMADGLLAEEYYQAMPKLTIKLLQPAGQGQSAPGKGECGSAAGGSQRPWEHDAPEGSGAEDKDRGEGKGGTSSTPGIGEAEGEVLRRQVANDVKEHASQNRGDVPEWMKRWAEATLNPKVDWRKVLFAIVKNAQADAAGMCDYSYARPSRRAHTMPRVVLPSMRQPIPRISVVIDTSGSIGQEELSTALAEIGGILKAAGQKEGIRAIVCDANVKSAKRVFKADQIEAIGGGGTDMRVGIVEALKDRPHAIIVLTDGYTPWPSEPTRSRVVAAIIGGTANGVPEWIKVVEVEKVA